MQIRTGPVIPDVVRFAPLARIRQRLTARAAPPGEPSPSRPPRVWFHCCALDSWCRENRRDYGTPVLLIIASRQWVLADDDWGDLEPVEIRNLAQRE